MRGGLGIDPPAGCAAIGSFVDTGPAGNVVPADAFRSVLRLGADRSVPIASARTLSWPCSDGTDLSSLSLTGVLLILVLRRLVVRADGVEGG